MIILFITVIIGSILSFGIYHLFIWHWQRLRLYKLASEFEGPPALPIIGNGGLFFEETEKHLSTTYELLTSYPSPFRAWLGPVLIIVITDPEQMKTVCFSNKTLNKGKLFTDFAKPFLGSGLLVSPVSTWKVHRKLVQSTFNKQVLDSFVEIFTTQSKVMVDRWEKYLNGSEFEIFIMISDCTLDMICESAMGVKVGAQTDGNCRYVESALIVLNTACERIYKIWMHPDFIFHLTKTGKDQLKHVKYMNDFTDNVIKARKEELSKCKTSGKSLDECDLKNQKKAFLDYFISLSENNNGLTDEEIREEVDTIILAGTDTSAITISYSMLMLASYPDVQEKVYEELYEIYGNKDIEEHPVTPKDLANMKYMERVIKETMRIFPPGPIIIRHVTEELEVDGHTMPIGSTALMSILNLHRNDKYWPDALKFDPDRFLPEQISQRHPYAFMGFSAGPRNCIGMNYALMAVKTLLATILRRYVLKKDKIIPIKDIKLKMGMTLKPVDPIEIRIEKRIYK